MRLFKKKLILNIRRTDLINKLKIKMLESVHKNLLLKELYI